MTCLTVQPTRNNLSHEINRMFNDFFVAPTAWSGHDASFMPRVNIKDNEEELSLVFEIPGMNKEDIKVALKDSVLTVSGKREFTEEEKEENYVRSEIRTGSFERSFTLPETVDAEMISADYKNGMLTVKLAKKEEVKPKEIDVKIS